MHSKTSVFVLFAMLMVGCAGRTTIIHAPGPVLAPSARPIGFWENREAVVQVRHSYQEWVLDIFTGKAAWEKSGGMASGVIIKTNGLVLTNNHIVDAGFERQIKPVIKDEKFFVCKVPNGIPDCKLARLVATNPEQDVAFLKVDTDFSKAIEFGDDTTLVAGDEVYMWGNAGKLVPIAPLFGRFIGRISEPYIDSAQTTLGLPMLLSDLSTIGGFSAGPIFNMSGKLVGLGSRHTHAKYGRPLSISIPSTTILRIIKDNDIVLDPKR